MHMSLREVVFVALTLFGTANAFAQQPPPPTLLAPVNQTVADPTTVRFSWRVAAGYSSYLIVRPLGGSWDPHWPGGVSGESWETRLLPNTSYEWVVAAVDWSRQNSYNNDWFTWSYVGAFGTGSGTGTGQTCTPNNTQERSCTTSNGCPGRQLRQCRADGTGWHEWGTCGDVPGDNCPVTGGSTLADVFQFPVSGTWNVGCNGYWGTCYKPWHLAEDVGRNAGTPVVAPANGTVKHARERDGYGTVVIIEHDTGGETVTSVLGHLRARDLRVAVGQSVRRGEIVGYLGDSSENGGYVPHIHFGIRRGGYAGDFALACDNKWAYGGYAGHECVRDEWYVPSAFVISHSNMTCTP